MKSKKKLTKLPNHKSLKSLWKKTWTQWSIYIRAREADWRGNAKCFSCGTTYHWKLLQAGHFHHQILDFYKYNIHPQCVRCNKWKSGNLASYATALVINYGPRIIKKLDQAKRDYKPYTFTELEKRHSKLINLNKKNGYI